MNRPFSILASVVVAGWLASPPALTRGTPVEAEATNGQVATGAHDPAYEEAGARQEVAEAEQTRAWVEQLARLEAEQRRQSELEAQRPQDLLGLQAARAAAWSEVLRTNWPAYQALLQKAALSPQHSTLCTFCEGRNQMSFCVLCGNNGKCVRCNGSGRTFGNPCATCRGKGKCFLCFGTGKMTCPFCEAGFVYYLKGSAPPAAMPVPSAPALRPSSQPILALPEPSSTSDYQIEPPDPPPPEAEPPKKSKSGLPLGVALFLCGILLIRKLAPGVADLLNARYNSWAPLATAVNGSPPVRAEERSFAEFLAEFRIGPKAPPPSAPGDRRSAEEAESTMTEANPLQQFLASAPQRLLDLRKLLQRIGRTQDQTARQRMLSQLGAEMQRLKGMAGLPELMPAWQMSCALGWLVKQISEKPSQVTSSTLRTLASGVDFLKELCRPGLRPDLCTNPPIRLLAVDDEPISRHAVSFALKKGFNQPDVAEDGPAGLELAAKHRYDAIFLDVEMPGMDGFELCSRIHETELNRATPVVFVTCRDNLESRSQATLLGAQDFIAKPFVVFEITVKAMTIVMRARLDRNGAAPASVSDPPAIAAAPAALAAPAAAAVEQVPSPDQPSPETGRDKTPKPGLVAENSGAGAEPAPSPHSEASASAETSGVHEPAPAAHPMQVPPDRQERAQTYFTHAPEQIEAIFQHLAAAGDATPDRLSTLLADLYLDAHRLSSEARRAELNAAFRLASALEAMLKKLFDHPTLCSPSTLEAAVGALSVLDELCRARMDPDLAQPAVRLLVVDDDPVAGRAMGIALQLVFGRPDRADSGEAALTFAGKQPYDLILLDVRMPGIDGFAACSKIHATALNRLTPVVFVTSASDTASRARAAACGGCGFIPKPVLASQVAVVALSYILRGRLGNQMPALKALPCPTGTCPQPASPELAGA